MEPGVPPSRNRDSRASGQTSPPPAGEAPEPDAIRLEDLRRSEQVMILVRWVASAFAVGQVLVYSTLPYPPGVEEAGLALAASLAATNLVILVLNARTRIVAQARALSLAVLSLDVLVTSGFVFLYAFDPISALWAILYVMPLEGAIRFQLPGALGTWAAITVLYTVREVWGSARYGYLLEWNSITFRMGLALLIALVAGLMARNLVLQRSRLERALGELRRTDLLRSSLVSTLAHDVRNPLFTIRGTFKMLLSHPERLQEDTARELIRAAERQAGRLERLAIDLLDLARLETGRLQLHVEAVRVRDAVARALSYADQQDRFEVRIGSDLQALADPSRFEQIVVNLATNALQHGEPPFVVEAREEKGSVNLEVRDGGPGIPPAQVDGLFEPFRANEAGSVGFGLAIVRALTEAHGGRVAYERQRPTGSCFRITLPAPAGAPAGQEGR